MHRTLRLLLTALAGVFLSLSLVITSAPSASAAPGSSSEIRTVGGTQTVCIQASGRYNNVFTQQCWIDRHLGYWSFTKVGGYWRITHKYSGKRLDSNAAGSVYLHAPNTGNYQLWVVQDRGNGQYRLLNRGTGRCLNNGYWLGRVTTQPCSTSKDQLYRI
ncbi:RICIN domain-containing protein [Propioniciclava coleopterorum]|uniref:RICIN domain-containing protein n=1 Tax=Propioniciclava coleopterorum TaxID=2714937 RepID=A0A6G7YA29_9ACTN|nr:RICIN domain-containing protein [Propioniciclava coleopterorum]QIK73467.1 RICIN domain-containing protein [Propioniciclava coleopterorum]